MMREYKFASRIYLGESIDSKKMGKIIKKLKKAPLLAHVYLLALATNDEDQLEFFDSRWLLTRSYDGYIPYIVGIASDREEAVMLIRRIVEECLKERGDCSLREYLSC
ncbi:MAG: hypothetical protein LUG83_09305 [Lachnospiraceae bacterium]|nr:hypothetical protein [Lachnospiraceae bacterium]